MPPISLQVKRYVALNPSHLNKIWQNYSTQRKPTLIPNSFWLFWVKSTVDWTTNKTLWWNRRESTKERDKWVEELCVAEFLDEVEMYPKEENSDNIPTEIFKVFPVLRPRPKTFCRWPGIVLWNYSELFHSLMFLYRTVGSFGKFRIRIPTNHHSFCLCFYFYIVWFEGRCMVLTWILSLSLYWTTILYLMRLHMVFCEYLSH